MPNDLKYLQEITASAVCTPVKNLAIRNSSENPSMKTWSWYSWRN